MVPRDPGRNRPHNQHESQDSHHIGFLLVPTPEWEESILKEGVTRRGGGVCREVRKVSKLGFGGFH